MSTTAIFYSPEGGSVDRVAHQLGSLIGEDKAHVIPATKLQKDKLDQHEQLILVGSTVGADHWDNEVIVDEWLEFFSRIGDGGFKNKKVAIIGLGNSVLYPEHFADGMAELHAECTSLGAQVFGKVEAKDYDFTDSESVDEDGFFCGLAIDEDNEPGLTSVRLEKWIQELTPDFSF